MGLFSLIRAQYSFHFYPSLHLLAEGMLAVTLNSVLSFKETQLSSCRGFVTENNRLSAVAWALLATHKWCWISLCLTHTSPVCLSAPHPSPGTGCTSLGLPLGLPSLSCCIFGPYVVKTLRFLTLCHSHSEPQSLAWFETPRGRSDTLVSPGTLNSIPWEQNILLSIAPSTQPTLFLTCHCTSSGLTYPIFSFKDLWSQNCLSVDGILKLQLPGRSQESWPLPTIT